MANELNSFAQIRSASWFGTDLLLCCICSTVRNWHRAQAADSREIRFASVSATVIPFRQVSSKKDLPFYRYGLIYSVALRTRKKSPSVWWVRHQDDGWTLTPHTSHGTFHSSRWIWTNQTKMTDGYAEATTVRYATADGGDGWIHNKFNARKRLTFRRRWDTYHPWSRLPSFFFY